MVTVKLLRIWILLMQIVMIYGFGAYFHINYIKTDYYGATDYCKGIGMQLAKIDNIGLHKSAEQFLLDQQIAERVWMSLTCPTLPCQWGDGYLLDWSNWKTADEPIYECVVFEYELSAFATWRSRKCLDPYISLCIAPAQPSFSFLSGLYNFYEASVECQAIGGQLAVLNNPEVINRVMDELYGMTITNDIWIGLYGNGTNFVWQNMVEAVSYANWNTTAPQIYSGVAVVMTKSDFTWRGRQMTDRTGHALCQVNYLPVLSGLTYAEAKAECLKYALHPALLRTQEEHIIAKNALNTPNTVTDTFWVGLTLNGTQFTWSDGTPALFTDWMQGEPNNMDIAKCVIIVGSEFRWDSKDCTRLDNLLCQYPTKNRLPISNDIDQVGDVTMTTIGGSYPPKTTSASYPPTPSSVSAGDITHRHFLLNALDAEPQNQSYHVTQCQSKIRCADLCLADRICAAFVFNGWQCLLYTSFNSGSVNHIAGSAIWK